MVDYYGMFFRLEWLPFQARAPEPHKNERPVIKIRALCASSQLAILFIL